MAKTKSAQLLRVADVAAMMGVSDSRIYQLVRSGEIPSTRIGGAIRIPRGAWDKWLEQQTKRAMKSLRKNPNGRNETNGK